MCEMQSMLNDFFLIFGSKKTAGIFCKVMSFKFYDALWYPNKEISNEMLMFLFVFKSLVMSRLL